MAFSMDNITSSASNLIGGGVKFIGDGVSSVTKTIGGFFAGDGPLDSLGPGSKKGNGTLWQYPETLGATATDTQYESDPVEEDSEFWIDYGSSTDTSDPFITFAFKEISTTMADVQQKKLASQKLVEGVLITAAASSAGSLVDSASKAMGIKQDLGSALQTGSYLVATKYVFDAVHSISKTLDEKPKRHTRQRVALYMPAGIQVNDGANYDPLSKKSLAYLAELDKGVRDKDGNIKSPVKLKDGKTWKDAALSPLDTAMGKNTESNWDFSGDGQIATAAMLGETVAGGGLIGGAASKFSAGTMSAFATMGTTIKLVGDEELRMLGKALNPNEYMQFKSTNLRQFSLSFKFLPDSITESNHVKNIIRIFREALYPIKHSGLTMTVPDVLALEFHNVSGMIKMPDLALTNINISYNPNAASFFKQSGQPVEISMDIQMQELYPIHRSDITEGY